MSQATGCRCHFYQPGPRESDWNPGELPVVINNPLDQTFPVWLVVAEITYVMNAVGPSCSSRAKLFGSKYINPEFAISYFYLNGSKYNPL